MREFKLKKANSKPECLYCLVIKPVHYQSMFIHVDDNSKEASPHLAVQMCFMYYRMDDR